MNQLLMTVKQVAEYLHVEEDTVRRLVRRGELAAYRICGEYRFADDDLQVYLGRSRVIVDFPNMVTETHVGIDNSEET